MMIKDKCICNMKWLFIFIFLLYLLGSCNTSDKMDKEITFKTNYSLRHKLYDTELLISQGSIAIIDTFLLVISNMQEDFCKIYSIPGGMREVGAYGRIGNGPGEFLQPLYTYTNGNHVGVNEVNKQELAILELTPNAKIKEIKRMKAPYKPKRGELNLPDYYFIQLDSSHFVSLLCDSQKGFFTLFDTDLNPIEKFGESPIKEELPPYASRTRLKGAIAAKNGTMVFATSYLPYLSCYQLQSGKMQKQWSFFFDKTFYEVRNGDLLFSKEKSFGQILSLYMDEQYILCSIWISY